MKYLAILFVLACSCSQPIGSDPCAEIESDLRAAVSDMPIAEMDRGALDEIAALRDELEQCESN